MDMHKGAMTEAAYAQLTDPAAEADEKATTDMGMVGAQRGFVAEVNPLRIRLIADENEENETLYDVTMVVGTHNPLGWHGWLLHGVWFPDN